MSKYTTTFRNLIEGGFVSREDLENVFKSYDLSDYLTDEEIAVIEERGTWSKDRLAKKIVDHYYLRDLGFETYAMFKHYAMIQMQEIMESKLPLIYSSSIKYDPMVNVDFKEMYTASSSESANGSGLTVSSDTPQGQINKQDILSGQYASNTGASETQSSINDSSSNSNNTDETYTKKVKGNSGVSATAQKMIQQYRENIIAIDEDIIKELDKLFMGLY